MMKVRPRATAPKSYVQPQSPHATQHAQSRSVTPGEVFHAPSGGLVPPSNLQHGFVHSSADVTLSHADGKESKCPFH